MRWEIGEKVRAHIVGFSGVNFSGERWEVDIWHLGGRQGDDIDGSRIKSIGIIAHPGTRMILKTAASATGWEALPWRCIQVMEGFTFTAQDGKRVGVQVPDLDRMDKPEARRLDPDIERSFPFVERFEDGTGWTFGRPGGIGLKCNVKAIRVERFDL